MKGHSLETILTTGTGPVWLFMLVLTVFNLSWIAVYALAIYVSHRDKVVAIPLPALALNLAWDINVLFVLKAPLIQKMGIVIYLLLQGIILWQTLQYGGKSIGRAWAHIVGSSITFAVVFTAVLAIELRDMVGWEIGFIDNFVNSACFVWLFYSRKTLAGQSLWIGILKLVGTGAVSLSAFIYPWNGYEDSLILPLLYGGILVLDVFYVALVYTRQQELNVNFVA
jgi:hypothetical protein